MRLPLRLPPKPRPTPGKLPPRKRSLEKLQHVVDLEQEIVDELKQQGGQA
jgi:hypothetical protein